MNARSAIALVVILGSGPAAFAQGTAPEKLDVAGIRLGMTEGEVRGALKAFDPELKVAAVTGVFNYSDGVNHALKTPGFLDRLEAGKGNQGASIKVYFSGPVGDVRAIGVSRTAFLSGPPTRAQMLEGLVAKYGPPAGLNNASQSAPVWEAAGKPSCVRVRDYKGQVAINYGAGDVGGSMMINSSAEKSLASRRGSQSKGLMPADLAQCGAYLAYNFRGDPVRDFDAYLYDLGAMVATERSRTAWVKQFQAEAAGKRQGQGQVPKF
jgi:hypothetical protein